MRDVYLLLTLPVNDRTFLLLWLDYHGMRNCAIKIRKFINIEKKAFPG